MSLRSRIAITVALVSYNNVLNLWRPFHGRAYPAINAAATAALLYAARGPLGLSNEELYLGPRRSALRGLLLGAAATIPVFGLAFDRRTARFVADRRTGPLEARDLLFHALIRVPIGTAVWEEILFRSFLPALWRSHGPRVETAVSAIGFGMWHIAPTHIGRTANAPHASLPASGAVLGGAIAGTAAGGWFLLRLTQLTGSVWASVMLHAATNSLATVASAVAWRRAEKLAGDRERG